MRTLTPFVLLGAALSGCAQHATHRQLLARASFEMACPDHALQVYTLDARTRGVDGCGRRAVYVEVCETGASRYGAYRHNCTWVLNHGATAAPATPAPAPEPAPAPWATSPP